MEELRLSLSRLLLGMRSEVPPFIRYEGIADLGFGPSGGEVSEPIMWGARWRGKQSKSAGR